jgi:colicin import membrane protein
MPPKQSRSAEQKESSVLFSLKELMNLEEDRIKAEEADKEARAKADAERRAAEERARREAEERRLQDEEEARHADEVRRREEATRLEAIQRAEIEKGRAESEQRARMAQIAAQQAHERSLAELQQDKGKKRLTYAAIVLGVVLVGGGIITAVTVSKAKEEQQAREAVLTRQRLETEQKLAAMQRDFEDKKKAELALQGQLAAAKDDADRVKIEAELAKAKKAREAAGVGVAGVKKEGGGSKPGCNCPPGDPLCSCL